MSLSIPSPGANARMGIAPDDTADRRKSATTSTPGPGRSGVLVVSDPVHPGDGATVKAPSPAGSTDGGDTASSGAAAPKPVRFPWLSRLSQQLESASRSKPAFPAAPVIGENVDRKV